MDFCRSSTESSAVRSACTRSRPALVGLVVTGQLLFTVLVDNYGWLGLEPHYATIWRGLGCVLMMGAFF
jgi:uncharacterized membrane protein YdcZ (DUF606 family)